MTEIGNWRTGVSVARAGSLKTLTAERGRATAFNFLGTGGNQTWIGPVSLQPGAKTGAHHHGDTETAVYVASGRGEIRWGERLEFATEVGPGDFVYFAPNVPHQERNLDGYETLDFVSIRSNTDGTMVKLDVAEVERPETLY